MVNKSWWTLEMTKGNAYELWKEFGRLFSKK